MMKLLYSPQVNTGKKIVYSFGVDTIIAQYEGKTDTFDFSAMPDGEAGEIETTLSLNPILKAERKNGILSVELLNFIDENATELEKFPLWTVV